MQHNKNKIRILVTGGTFDKEYNEIEEKLIFKDTHVPELLKKARCELTITVRNIMMVDSLHMTNEDRKIIVQHCKKTEEDKIIITHGTGTMAETARVLAKEIKNKTIVLTGAMIPYHYGSSDGFFNMGTAIAFVQTLPFGVYIAMNGKYFLHNNVRKNTETGKFEELH